MISESQAKLGYFLLRKSLNHKGFTLIELIVVILILGILVSIALPNFLRQAGKARETEIKNAVGTINRSQQAYHWEKGIFASGTDQEALRLIGVQFDTKYITSFNIEGDEFQGTVAPVNSNYGRDQTRAFSGATFFSSVNLSYSMVICQSLDVAESNPVPVAANDCGSSEVIK
jgi:type IV pilus assembly protein PilA